MITLTHQEFNDHHTNCNNRSRIDMKSIRLFIPGIPQAKQSARFRIAGNQNKAFIQSYQSKKVKDEERSIKMIIKEQLPEDFICHSGPISVSWVKFQFPPMKSMRKSDLKLINEGKCIAKTTKPDLTDNLMKGLFDAMQGIVYANDSQIWWVGSTCKVYDREPGTALEIVFQ